MNLGEEAYALLWGTERYSFSVAYSGRFSAYNANVRKRGNVIAFNLSRNWRGVSREIVLGLLQDMLVRLLRMKKQTLNMELYGAFIRSIQKTNVQPHADEALAASFRRVNVLLFDGMLDLPNMVWGAAARRKLASYDHHSDTVTVSALFRDAPSELLDYLVYHELLHKKLQYRTTNGRTLHHSAAFRRLEKRFPGAARLEVELGRFLKVRKKTLASYWPA